MVLWLSALYCVFFKLPYPHFPGITVNVFESTLICIIAVLEIQDVERQMCSSIFLFQNTGSGIPNTEFLFSEMRFRVFTVMSLTSPHGFLAVMCSHVKKPN